MPGPDLLKLSAIQSSVSTERQNRDQAISDLAAVNAQLTKIDQAIASLNSTGNTQQVKDLSVQRAALSNQRTALAGNVSKSDANLRNVIAGIPITVDVCDADPTLPLLLLPVRLETRFAPDGRSIRIRIFPDDIHIDQLDRGVSDEERSSAITYWSTIWRADDDTSAAAWRSMVLAVGRLRATWVATATSPTNLLTRLTDATPIFPPTTARTKRAAVARLLPDRFVAMAMQNGNASTKIGNAIAPETTVGLFANDGSELQDVVGLKMTPGAEWLANYDEAEKIGLAITLPLKTAGKIDQLFVCGARRSISPTKIAEEFDDLLTSHKCSLGMAFIRPGTPTNNTETDRAAWQLRIEPVPPPRDAASLPPGSNAAILASSVGIAPETLSTLSNAEMGDQSLAKFMSTSLWEPTWATYFEKVNVVVSTGSTLSSATREKARVFDRDFVRGRGPLPSLRVGNQPYGILPVSSMSKRWKSDANDTFETGLLDLLRKLRARWMSSLDVVATVEKGPLDTAMVEILGSSAVSFGLRIRSLLSDEFAHDASSILGLQQDSYFNERLYEELLLAELTPDPSKLRFNGSLSSDTRPVGLPLIDLAREADVIDAIIANGSPKVTSVFQALVTIAWDRLAGEVKSQSAGGKFSSVLLLAEPLVPTASRNLILALADRANRTSADAFFAAATDLNKTIPNVPTPADLQPIPALKHSFGELALAATTNANRAQLGAFATVAWLQASGRLAELKEALLEVAAVARAGDPTGQLKIAAAETLDCASHRLDAWLTAVVEKRRQAQRLQVPQGLQIGAYGWVEGIKPDLKPVADGGFIAAPSMGQATTAGILRSAYLSHNADSGGSNAFAIDLSSSRVRSAMHLIDGIRSGQSLSALTGYKLERRLHEAKLDRLVLKMRAIAPLNQGRLTDRQTDVAQAAVEFVASANVTDGVLLVEKFQGKVQGWDKDKIHTDLMVAPKGNLYLTRPWPIPTAEELAKVDQAITDTAADIDAVADLLMAESVHQLAQGNMSRASAALDGAGTGDVPPPEPDVISTRRDEVPFTHRVMMVFGDGIDVGGGWNSNQPRALVSPQLENWAAKRLGPASQIMLSPDNAGGFRSASQTKLCALDFIYGATTRANLESRLRRSIDGLPFDAVFVDGPQVGFTSDQKAFGDMFQLAASLRRLLVGAHPAEASDFVVANVPAVREVADAEIEAVRQRLIVARSGLSVLKKGIDQLLTQTPIDFATLGLLLDALADYGVVSPNVPPEQIEPIAQLASAESNRRLDLTKAAPPTKLTADSIIEFGKIIFGDGFWALMAFDVPSAADSWLAALSGGPDEIGASPSEIRRYISDVSSVRQGMSRYSETMMLAEAVALPAELRAIQLAGAGKDIPNRWIGGPLDPKQPTSTAPVTSIVLESAGKYDPKGKTFALILDHWTEVMPLRERRGVADDAPIDSRVAAGVSFNAHAASARPPQAMLLAVSPDGARWTTDALVDVLKETLDLAKMRMVTLEHTNGLARVLPALYSASVSLQGEKVLDPRFLTQATLVKDAVPAYIKELGK